MKDIILGVICFILAMIDIIYTSRKYINDEAINGMKNGGEYQRSLLIISVYVVIWFVLTISSAVFFAFMYPEESAMILVGLLGFSGILSGIIVWSIFVHQAINSKKSKEEKKDFYLQNNFVFGIGVATTMEGLIGLMLFIVGLIPTGHIENSFHLEKAIVGVFWIIIFFGVPMWLIVKIPKWIRNYVEKRM